MSNSGLQLHSQHCPKDTTPESLDNEQIKKYLKELPQWDYSVQNNKISRQFVFKNYYETLAFINAVAWIAHQENHHPEITFGYNKCTIYFTTHSANGITLFDFICAARVDQL